MDDSILEQEKVNYRLVERDEQITDLSEWIAGADSKSERVLMIEDLKQLAFWEDEYVFANISTNEFVSPTQDTERLMNFLIKTKWSEKKHSKARSSIKLTYQPFEKFITKNE